MTTGTVKFFNDEKVSYEISVGTKGFCAIHVNIA